MARLNNEPASKKFVDKTGEEPAFYDGFDGRPRYTNLGDEYLSKFVMRGDDGLHHYTDKELKMLKSGVDIRHILFLRAIYDTPSAREEYNRGYPAMIQRK